jgi:hypothetical protein
MSEMLTLDEAREVAGLTKSGLDNWFDKGWLTKHRVPQETRHSTTVRIDRAELEQVLERRRTEAAARRELAAAKTAQAERLKSERASRRAEKEAQRAARGAERERQRDAALAQRRAEAPVNALRKPFTRPRILGAELERLLPTDSTGLNALAVRASRLIGNNDDALVRRLWDLRAGIALTIDVHLADALLTAAGRSHELAGLHHYVLNERPAREAVEAEAWINGETLTPHQHNARAKSRIAVDRCLLRLELAA